jgi:hypothetical protein
VALIEKLETSIVLFKLLTVETVGSLNDAGINPYRKG